MQNATLDAQIKALNDSFRKHIDSVSASDNSLVNPWTSAVEDYLMYVRLLKETYCVHDGVLLSWGTGDCGQLGHGQDENEMWIENKRPKVIKGLPKCLAQVAAA